MMRDMPIRSFDAEKVFFVACLHVRHFSLDALTLPSIAGDITQSFFLLSQ
jgi:hypothetical protein